MAFALTMAYLSPLEKLLGYIDELDDILPEDDKSLLDEVFIITSYIFSGVF